MKYRKLFFLITFISIMHINGLRALAPIGSSPFLCADPENSLRLYFGHAVGYANLHRLPGGTFRKYQDVGSGYVVTLRVLPDLGLQAGMLEMNRDKCWSLNANILLSNDDNHYFSIAPGIIHSSGVSTNRHFNDFSADNTEDHAELWGLQLPMIYTMDTMRHLKINACVKATYAKMNLWGSYSAQSGDPGFLGNHSYDIKGRESFTADASLSLDAKYDYLIMSQSVGLMMVDSAQKGTTGVITYGFAMGITF